ncbi:MAG TPA: hypothetical protein VNF45_00950, partial [Candidatus Binataceae bacterium]|nr:hypothetical protein [Candidatus Binataceae bacterium]
MGCQGESIGQPAEALSSIGAEVFGERDSDQTLDQGARAQVPMVGFDRDSAGTGEFEEAFLGEPDREADELHGAYLVCRSLPHVELCGRSPAIDGNPEMLFESDEAMQLDIAFG